MFSLMVAVLLAHSSVLLQGEESPEEAASGYDSYGATSMDDSSDATSVDETSNSTSTASATDSSETGAPSSPELAPIFQELGKKTFGVQAGSTFDNDVKKWFPEAKLVYYTSLTDLTAALKIGKIDAFLSDVLALEMMKWEDSKMKRIYPILDEYTVGFVFAKTPEGEHLRDLMDAWLTQAMESGRLEVMLDKWLHAKDEEKTMPDYASLPAENGTLVFATEAGYPPFNYLRLGEVVGFEVEMAIDFCAKEGNGIEIVPMSFDGLLPSIQSGKVDFAGSGIEITPERMESVLYSQSYYTGGSQIVVRETKDIENMPFQTKIHDSIEKTFVREHRWKLFVRGSINTLVVTVFSLFFGTLFGFFVFLLYRGTGKLITTLTGWFMWVLQGMPTVVLIMILYYIIFRNSQVNGVLVSIVGFTITFGVSVIGMLQSSVATMDRGQYEAACALGYTPQRTFFRIILPQALPLITDSFLGATVELIKGTSIVGYIAVLDLTKMGDLIRSRTYEAFFPLIAVMLVYYVLEAVLGFLIKKLLERIDPRNRKYGLLLKGVDQHD